MKYMGSKSRIAKYIVPIIQKYIDDNNVEKYIEPFVGGANVIDKIKCKEKYGSDNHRYLIALLQQAAKDITVFPVSVTKDEYNDVKRNKDNYPDWYVGLVGFCASYNAKYFGGYANNVHTKIGTIRNYTDEAIRNLIKQSDNLKECIFSCNDFREIRNIEKTLIYCDPPL